MERTLILIRGSVKNSVNEDFLPKFTTSTGLDVAMKDLAVMDAMKQYFDYGMRFCCGLPKVGFIGTVADWGLLKETVIRLSRFSAKEDKKMYLGWVSKIVSIVDQFVLTMEGKVNLDFWNGVVQERVTHGSGGSTYIKGWLNALLVMDWDRELDLTDGIPSTRFNVPVAVNDNGYEFNVTIVGGFNGVVYDPKEVSWTPYRSYAVVKEDKGRKWRRGRSESSSGGVV